MTYRFMALAFLEPVAPSTTETVLVEVTQEKSFDQLAKELEEKRIIRSPWAFKLLARLKSNSTRISEGEYELSGNMTPEGVLSKLASGETFMRRIDLHPGRSIWELGPVLEEAGLLSREEFDKAIVDPRLLAAAGINASSFEGYLAPSSYDFSRPITPRSIIWRMLEEAERTWLPQWTQRADELQLSRHEVLTLASIIEKESSNPDYQGSIAAVLHNRLTNGMKLQSKATVRYGLPNVTGELTEQDLLAPSAYNTFTNFGLPPGPITNPGVNAIQAALYPPDLPYLFYLPDGSGGFVFSTTLEEHNEALARLNRPGATPR